MRNTIKVERAKKNWTQADLAERIGISRQAMNAIEKGKFIPSTLLALKMAHVFGTPLEEVFVYWKTPILTKTIDYGTGPIDRTLLGATDVDTLLGEIRHGKHTRNYLLLPWNAKVMITVRNSC